MQNIKFNVQKLARYAKAAVAVCGVLVLAAKAVMDGVVTGDEIVQVGIAVAVAFGVYQVKNEQL